MTEASKRVARRPGWRLDMAIFLLAVAAAGYGALSCGGSSSADDAGACSQGDTRPCVGAGQCKGGQTCGAPGVWSPCDCGSIGGGTGTGFGGGAGAGGQPAGASGGISSGGAIGIGGVSGGTASGGAASGGTLVDGGPAGSAGSGGVAAAHPCGLTQNDRWNCGSCGHVCFGAETAKCVDGRCGPGFTPCFDVDLDMTITCAMECQKLGTTCATQGCQTGEESGRGWVYAIKIRYYEPPGQILCDNDPTLTKFASVFDASDTFDDLCNSPINHNTTPFGRARCCCQGL